MKKRIIFHIDVNNAFLSWTAINLLNNGYKIDIRNIYSVIGGDEDKRKGVVLAKSFLAKRKEIVTGESLYEARKKYRDIKVFSPNHELYKKMSQKLYEYLSKYTSDIEMFSIDECFIDYTPIEHIYGDPIDFGFKIKDEVKNKLGFTVNIGIGNNKLCAKMASDFEKPDKVHTLYEEEISNKMWPLPIRELYGVGKQTSIKLESLGIKTIGDLANYDLSKINIVFKKQGSELWKFANGIDDSEVISDEVDSKCISNSVTLEKNIIYSKDAYPIIMSLCENVGLTLRRQNKYAYVIAIQIKDKYFHSYSHQKKLDNPTNLTNEIYKWAIKLFEGAWKEEAVRLIGVHLSNLTDKNPYQISLFEEVKNVESDEKLQHAIDKLKNKYGNEVITKAISNKNKIEKHL